MLACVDAFYTVAAVDDFVVGSQQTAGHAVRARDRYPSGAITVVTPLAPGTLIRGYEIVELIAQRAEAGSLPEFEPLPRAGQLVLIGDFLSPLDAVNAALARFAGAGLKGHLLQVVDPAEEDLPFDGRVRFAGIEERDEVVISRVESIRGDYASRFLDHRAGLAAIAGRLGWTFAAHRTDRPPGLALLALYEALSGDERR